MPGQLPQYDQLSVDPTALTDLIRGLGQASQAMPIEVQKLIDAVPGYLALPSVQPILKRLVTPLRK